MTNAKPTEKQMAFSETMTERQWRVLHYLWTPYYLSASERADTELWALVRHGLAYAWPGNADEQSQYMWKATDIGEALAKAHFNASGAIATA